MKTRIPKYGIIFLTALMMFVASFQGCDTQKDPFSTVNEEPAMQNDAPRRLAELNIVRTNPASFQKYFVKSKMIYAAWGGTISVGDDVSGMSKITIVPGAINQNTMVTFEWNTSGLLMGGATFSPHGLQFNSPAIVQLSYKDADLTGINEYNLKIWYFNEVYHMWELVPSVVNVSNKTVTAFLDHFSRYAISAE